MSKAIKDLIVFFALLTPCMPKIGISEEITILPIEILLFLLFPFILKYNKFRVQRLLYGVWVTILVSTLLSCIMIPNLGGVLRGIKELIYIPIAYVTYKCNWLSWKHISYSFICASCISFVFLASAGFSFSSMSIWDNSLLLSGMSNKYLDVRSFSIVNIDRGAHGIFSNYCSLALCSTFIAYRKKEIRKIVLIIVLLLVCSCVGMSVSREGLIVFFSVIASFVFCKFKEGKIRTHIGLYLFITFFLLVIIYVINEYGENIALVQKLLYTQQSVEDSGEEGNIALRIGGWAVFFRSLFYYPYMAIIGYGFNNMYYESFLDFARLYKFRYVTGPESFFVECLMYGGIIALFFGIRWWRQIYIIICKVSDGNIKFFSKGLFWGLLFVNTFSGASIVSDMLYCQFLVFIGLIIREVTLNTKFRV